LLRAWTDTAARHLQQRGEDLNASLTTFEEAIHQDRQR
jgi:hypothetical protein